MLPAAAAPQVRLPPVTGPLKPSANGQAYRHASGIIVICMYCRRTLRPESEGAVWDLVEEFLAATPPGASHGLCGDCLHEHYPGQR